MVGTVKSTDLWRPPPLSMVTFVNAIDSRDRWPSQKILNGETFSVARDRAWGSSDYNGY